MAKSNNVETDTGEPSSYQLMEKTLSMAVANAGETSQESESSNDFLRKGRMGEEVKNHSIQQVLATPVRSLMPSASYPKNSSKTPQATGGDSNATPSLGRNGAASHGDNATVALTKNLGTNGNKSQPKASIVCLVEGQTRVVKGESANPSKTKACLENSHSEGVTDSRAKPQLGAPINQLSIPITNGNTQGRDKVILTDEGVGLQVTDDMSLDKSGN